ncbi:hypothetical protein BJ138DRAFT_179893 [Hygrophoropsis aurantiaca]|uniref:Uncharacterized protein n=1 Tax=Hygrophoropsis aurantiaca TaxID=72124 RepID=A0ACB8A9E5_9AGAM|nr:hypothetical protein BJ138DRAFT_179893 [Hygrophoropsis aurantiaca]
MTLKDPAWRQKTRPCPFFSQGRCLFSDSCNFLHDVKVRSEVDYSLTDAKLVENRVFSPPKSAFSPPSVVVNSASPRSIRVPSNNRSPRLSGLLLALQDVIGPSKESLEEDESLTDVSDTELLQVPSNDTPEHNSDITLDDSTIVADSLVDSTLPSLVHPPFTASVEVGVASDSDSEDEEEDPEPPSYILDEDSFQSEPDGQHTMIAANRPSALSAVHEAGSGRSPSGEDAQTASSLLSPIQLSARLRPFSLCSRPAREDSIDSGYADSWTGPLPFTRSPPRSALSSPASFHFGRVSLTSPLPLSRRTSYDVRAIRPSPSSYKISENEGDAEDEDEDEGEDELTFSILEAYDAFPMPPGDGVELEERDSMVSDYSSPTMRLPRDLKANTSDVIHSDPPTAEVVDETLPSNPQTTLKAILTSAMSSDDLMEETSLSGRNSIFSVGSRPSSPNTSLLSASCDDSLQSESQDEASESSLGLAYDDPSLAVDDSSSMFVSADNCGARWAMMSDVQSALERSTNRRSISISPHSDFNQEELEGCPSLASLDCDGEASESTTLSDCWPAGHGAPSDPVHEMRDTLESFSSTSRLDGPADHGTLEELNHVYDHLELANEDLSWVSDDPDKSMASTVDDSMTLPDNVSFGNDAHPVAPMQRDRATSDITIKGVSAISSALAPAESVPSSVFQRDRAASDLTVKGRSLSISSTEQGGAESPIRESSPTSAPPPMADNTCSVSGAFEGSDILQSLYDQYVDVESMDSSNILGELALQPNVMPDELSPKLGTRDLRASIDSLSNILADVDGLFSSSAPDSLQQAFNSFGLGASHFTGSLSDPPSAAAPLRPLMLTQDRHSSANFASVHSSPIQSNDYQPQQPSPPRDSASNLVARSTSRILSKEIGSTKIPFSFKRRNPQVRRLMCCSPMPR